MTNKKPYVSSWLFLIIGFILLFLLDISLGSVNIPFKATIAILTGQEVEESSWEQIILLFRLPRVFTAIAVGAGLAVSGLLMQTLFRNPLAGPYVLGISSGASLGVALVILASGVLSFGLLGSKVSILLAAGLGAAAVLLVVLLISRNIPDSTTLLILGLMFGSIAGAIVSVLQYYSRAEELQSFVIWTFGSLSHVRWADMPIFGVLVILGLILAFLIQKPLNSFFLGERQASSIGVNIERTRITVLIATSILAGSITAYCGPIAFIGLAVPHLTRVIFPTSNHKLLIPAVALSGAFIMVLADFIAQMPGSEHVLPINAVTALIGGPVIIWVIIRKRNIGKSFN
ncbi:MAG: iron ABC transporter permease [Bacteroidota bacterium]